MGSNDNKPDDIADKIGKAVASGVAQEVKPALGEIRGAVDNVTASVETLAGQVGEFKQTYQNELDRQAAVRESMRKHLRNQRIKKGVFLLTCLGAMAFCIRGCINVGKPVSIAPHVDPDADRKAQALSKLLSEARAQAVEKRISADSENGKKMFEFFVQGSFSGKKVGPFVGCEKKFVKMRNVGEFSANSFIVGELRPFEGRLWKAENTPTLYRFDEVYAVGVDKSGKILDVVFPLTHLDKEIIGYCYEKVPSDYFKPKSSDKSLYKEMLGAKRPVRVTPLENPVSTRLEIKQTPFAL